MADTFLIKKIGLTEKATILQASGKYMFLVKLNAKKPEIRKAIESLYQVKVRDVNTLRSYGKAKRLGGKFGKKPEYKKAVVTLAPGEKIDTAGTKA
ncbi:MAG: 50S ribosomal protein L23 [Candidatus Liptonbacteria bacterium]|nr:50S ribosomal protein L23 [Candidatus Liptonbacteria bacterium]